MKVSTLITLFLMLTFPVQGDPDAQQEHQSRFERGVGYLNTEQFDLALLEFQTLRETFEASPQHRSLAECYIGIVYQELNRLSEAAAAYHNALALKAPDDVHATAHLHLGIVYKAQGELERAETHLKQALVHLPETAEVRIHLGDVYTRQRRLNAAETAYRNAIRLNPEHTESYYGLGRVAELQNRLHEAVEHYDAALLRNRYLAQAHYRRALTYRRLGNPKNAAAAMADFQRLKVYEDTMHEYREALYRNPNLPMLYIKLGELHERYDNPTEAAQIYEVATQVHPSYLTGYTHLGNLYIKQRTFQKAAEAYQKAAQLSPNDPRIWLKLGAIRINQRQFEPAITAFEQATRVDSTNATAHNNLARLYAGLGKEMQRAVELAQRAVALAPTAKHYDTLAYVYYRNAQYPEALHAIQQALTLAPDAAASKELHLKIQNAQIERNNE